MRKTPYKSCQLKSKLLTGVEETLIKFKSLNYSFIRKWIEIRVIKSCAGKELDKCLR